MKLNNLNIEHFRGLDHVNLHFSGKINIFIGKNNSGKSSIMNAIANLQYDDVLTFRDIRIGFDTAMIRYTFDHLASQNLTDAPLVRSYLDSVEHNSVCCRINRREQIPNLSVDLSGQARENFEPIKRFSSDEPSNLIYPYLSQKKKNTKYSKTISHTTCSIVAQTQEYLNSKIDIIASNLQHPKHAHFINLCNDILQFPISTFPHPEGKTSGIYINEQNNIPLENLGAGVANLLGFLVNMIRVKNKIFLIEEPENDLHPKALKRLLEVIIDSSVYNQFFISTHSNIVLKMLGAAQDSYIFRFSSHVDDNVPTVNVSKICDADERTDLLEEMGYDVEDYGLWKGWLILEESSAERIIRQYLIPWFTPNLNNRLKTVSSRSVTQVENRFESLNGLFLYLHLTSVYVGKAWVLVDGDEPGKDVIEKLRTNYKTWNEHHFQTLSHEDFELYYPQNFKEKTEIEQILQIQQKKEKKKKKKELFDSLLTWIDEDETRAKNAFANSASEVINFLNEIERSLVAN